LERPYRLDEATLARVQRVYAEQAEDVELYAEQLRRWQAGSMSLARRQEVDRLAGQVEQWRERGRGASTGREQINEQLRRKLDEVTERWGVKVTAVEIREIVPPREVQEAMNRQMSAERTRRAAVTEADGKRQATITVAEGERQAQILRAEGEKQANILKAEGYAQALQTVFGAAQLVDAKTMTLQVIDGLKALGASPNSTFVIPMEFTRLLGQVGDYLDQSLRGDPTTPRSARGEDRRHPLDLARVSRSADEQPDA